jgi:hypothetical protein
MSNYEKILTLLVAILLVVVLLNFHEAGERQPPPGPNFMQSFGTEFHIGPYTTVVDRQSSGQQYPHCDELKNLIVAALHDISARLGISGADFEVNDTAIATFCHDTATVTLADADRNRLILTKLPFIRAVSAYSTSTDLGTEVRINATLVPAGALVPSTPTTYGDILIPDRYLDEASSTP